MMLVRFQFILISALSVLVGSFHAEEEAFVDRFIESPLLVLVAIIVIDVAALIYHKIRR